MENLIFWLLRKATFDKEESYGDFDSQLNTLCDNLSIYHNTLKEFKELAPMAVLGLATRGGFVYDNSEDKLHNEDKETATALRELAFGEAYSQLEEMFKEAQKLTIEELKKADLESIVSKFDLLDQVNDLTTREDLKEFAKEQIDNDNEFLAIHILEAIKDSEADYWSYDYSMGTLETPTPITNTEDLLGTFVNGELEDIIRKD